MGIDPPFDSLTLGWSHSIGGSTAVPLEMRSPKTIPASFDLARAYCGARADLVMLQIGLAPVSVLEPARELLLDTGLPTLIRWLDRLRRLPATAITHQRGLGARYDVEAAVLSLDEVAARATSMESPWASS